MNYHCPSLMLLIVACSVFAALRAFAATPDAVPPRPLADDPESLRRALGSVLTQRPRVLTTQADWDTLRQQIARPGLHQDLYRALYRAAEHLLDQPVVTRQMEGRRLLAVSRRCLGRVALLATVARLSDEQRFADRGAQEMLAAAAFTDWNPSHFLDVAEMTAGLAIGYDWLYDRLPETAWQTIATAIIEKGLRPGAGVKGGWVTGENNWTQVCHGGLTLGAIAVADTDPELAALTISRAVRNVPRAMHAYEPDGAYPEGPMYWSYGTTYNVLLIAALDKALGSDLGLTANAHGFAASPDYINQVTGPTGLFYNYADSGSLRRNADPVMFWFAQHYHRPDLAATDRRLLTGALARGGSSPTGDRMMPLLLHWLGNASPAVAGTQPPPAPLAYLGRGVNPVATFRTAWNSDATYVAVKGGRGTSAHAHLDAGSFILDADGVRWAIDLGSQSYHDIEARGMNLWSSAQDSQRWTIFRWSNFAHNTLTIDGQLQRVDGAGAITTFRPNPALVVIDLSATYANVARHVVRGVRLFPDGRVLLQDELDGVAGRHIRWAMLTNAAAEIDGSTAVLKQDGQTMTLRVLAPAAAVWQLTEVTAPHDFDAPIKNTRMIALEIPAAGDATSLRVLFVPGSDPNGQTPEAAPLAQW